MGDMSTITLYLYGLNIERFINKLSKNKVVLLSFKKLTAFDFSCKIYARDFKIFEGLAIEERLEIKEKKENGLIAFKKFCQKHIGLLVGCFLCFFIGFFLFGRVWNIEVYCDDKIEKSEIVSLLNEEGVCVGSRLYKIDGKKLEKYLLLNHKDCSLVSVMKRGSCLIVNIKKKNDVSEILKVSAPIVAPCAGVIEKITLVQGSLNVEVGDVVKKGDVLVDAFIINGDKKIEVQPKAQIYMRSWCEGSVYFEEGGSLLEKSGNVENRRYIEVFGLQLGGGGWQSKFDRYEIDKSSKNICKNMLIPFKIIVERYSELIYQTDTRKFEDVYAMLSEKSCNIARQKVVDGMLVKSEKTNYIKVGNRYVVTTVVEGTICVE